MEWRNRVTELLGSKYPLIQGAYGGFGTSAIAAPVSEAGGFGIITAGALRTPERLREDIRKARSMTDQPFGVNLSYRARAETHRPASLEYPKQISFHVSVNRYDFTRTYIKATTLLKP